MSDINKQGFESGRNEAVFTEDELREGLVFEEKPKKDAFTMPGEGKTPVIGE
jgi:hypothetical protein